MLTGRLHDAGLTIRRWYKQAWLQWLTAALFFFLMSWFYMGSSIQGCTVVTPAFNSDTSGGTAWFQWASGNHLNWASTTKSNYPVGESINRPQFVTAEAFNLPYRILSTLTSPICGLNLMILLAYMSTGLAMFGLVKWLFGRIGIAYFAGYAAAFVPYHQIKSHSHIIYMFGTVFIGMVWAFLWFVQRPSYKRLLPLALVTALAMYTDGYFILIAALLISSLFGVSLLRGGLYITAKKGLVGIGLGYQKVWRNIRQQFRYVIFFLVALLILLIPIVIIQKTHGHDIHNSLSTARGNIKIETNEYGARPLEFFSPSLDSPLTPSAYNRWRSSMAQQHSSNPSENTVYLGLTVIVLALIAIGLSLRRENRQLLVRPNLTNNFIVAVLGISFLVMASFSLEAHYTLFGRVLPAPMALLIKFTSNWRVPTRLFLAVDPLAVLLAATGLYLLTRKWPRTKYLLVVVLCSLLLLLEYLPRLPIHNGNLVTNTPQVYHQIASDPQVHVIAEYPILALQYVPSIFTFQQFHHKNIFNANDSVIGEDPFSQSIAGLGDEQTLGVLKIRGVNVVTSYGAPADFVAGLTPYYRPDTSSQKIGLPIIYSYRLSGDVAPRKLVLVSQQGFNIATVDDKQISHHVLSVPGELQVDTADGVPVSSGSYQASFDVTPYVVAQSNMTIKQGGQVIWSGLVTRTQNRHVDVTITSPDIEITVDKPIDITNLSAKRILIFN